MDIDVFSFFQLKFMSDISNFEQIKTSLLLGNVRFHRDGFYLSIK